MQGIELNPFQVEPGDMIATKFRKTYEGIQILKSHKVRDVVTCPSKPECRHIDGECYDARFSTVIIADPSDNEKVES